MALNYNSIIPLNSIYNELKNRPEELRLSLLQKLDEEFIHFDTLYRIPFLAGIVNKKFQVEIAKICLLRDEMEEGDMALQIQETMGTGIFSLIAQSERDESAVIDALIEKGRLEAGSEFEIKWRKILSSDDRRIDNSRVRNEKPNTDLYKYNNHNEIEERTSEIENSRNLAKNSRLLLFAGLFIIGLLFLLVLIWSGKANTIISKTWNRSK